MAGRPTALATALVIGVALAACSSGSDQATSPTTNAPVTSPSSAATTTTSTKAPTTLPDAEAVSTRDPFEPQA